MSRIRIDFLSGNKINCTFFGTIECIRTFRVEIGRSNCNQYHDYHNSEFVITLDDEFIWKMAPREEVKMYFVGASPRYLYGCHIEPSRNRRVPYRADSAHNTNKD